MGSSVLEEMTFGQAKGDGNTRGELATGRSICHCSPASSEEQHRDKARKLTYAALQGFDPSLQGGSIKVAVLNDDLQDCVSKRGSSSVSRRKVSRKTSFHDSQRAFTERQFEQGHPVSTLLWPKGVLVLVTAYLMTIVEYMSLSNVESPLVSTPRNDKHKF